jgi:RTX calcium-binding nonapeptide repeat (4 copies)
MSKVRIGGIPIRTWSLGLLGFDHLVLTFEPGRSLNQWHWFGIEAGRIFLAGIADPVLQVVGVDGRTTLAVLNILHDGTNDRIPSASELVDIIGSPAQRGSRIVPLANPQTAWRTMARFAKKIDAETFPYTGYAFPFTANATLNSTSLIASLLHYAGANIETSLPHNARFSTGRRTLLGTGDDNEMRIQNGFNALFGGAGRDRFFGTNDLMQTEKFYGGRGDDVFIWSKGHNVYHGGQKGLRYELDGLDTVVYDGVGPVYIRKPSNPHIPHFNAHYAVDHSFGEDWLLSIERLEWRDKNDFIRTGPDVGIIEEGLDLNLGAEQSHGPRAERGDIVDFAEVQSGLLLNAADTDAIFVQASKDDKKGFWIEDAEWVIGSSGDDRIYLTSNMRGAEGGRGNDLIDARLAAASPGAGTQDNATRLEGGPGDDTIVSAAGRTRAKGGSGADAFVLSSMTGLPASPGRVEFIIDDAGPTDRLLVPINFFTGGNGGRFDNSPLVEIGSPLDGCAGMSNEAELLRPQQHHGNERPGRLRLNRSSNVSVSIGFTIERSDLLINFDRRTASEALSFGNKSQPDSRGMPLAANVNSRTTVRVKNFQPGHLGIMFHNMDGSSTTSTLASVGKLTAPLPPRPMAPPTNPNHEQYEAPARPRVALLTKLSDMIIPHLNRKSAR